jgi:hypothetical protein
MAFLGILSIPFIMYGANEFSNTITNAYNFDYKTYLQNKISNLGTKSKIEILKIELKNNELLYQYYNNEYKNMFKKDIKFAKRFFTVEYIHFDICKCTKS